MHDSPAEQPHKLEMQTAVLDRVQLQAADAPLDSQEVAGMNGSAMRGLLDANSEQPQAAVLAGLADSNQSQPAPSGDLRAQGLAHMVVMHHDMWEVDLPLLVWWFDQI